LVLAAVVVLGGPAAAQAKRPFSSSRIISPASGSVLFYNGDLGAGTVTVTGSVSPATGGYGDVLCYTSSPTPYRVAIGLPLAASGAFSATVSLAVIHGQACVLRFVPAGSTPSHAAAVAFAGPVISVSDQYSYSVNGVHYGYDLLGGVVSFAYELGSLGECPVRASFSTDPLTLSSYYLFDGNACLLPASGVFPDEGTRSAVQIDGLNAYSPAAIHSLTGLAGFQPLSFAASWSPDHEAVRVTETDSLVYCAPPGGYPPTTGVCPSLTSAGIVVRQTTQLLPGGQVARVTQKFTNTDSRPHELDLLFSQAVNSPAGGQLPGFEFPSQKVFASHGSPDSYTLFPRGAGTIYVIANAANAPASSNPIGAITYSRPPARADFVSPPGSQTAKFLMHYVAHLRPGGHVSYSWSFYQAASVSALTPLLVAARDQFLKPRLKLKRPHRGAVTRRSEITVSGVASDRIGIAWVSVDGQLARIHPGGRFRTKVRLHHGKNRIVVTAANLAGNTTTVRRTVDYKGRRRRRRQLL
jgi:hypothetical protein